MTKLSVNINKIATLRNARGGNVPNLLKVASDIEKFGADGITVHPRPDERHIRYIDVYNLAEQLTTEFNIEGFPSKKFIDLVLEVKPAQVTLVPDSPNVITSNAGWNVKENQAFLKPIIAKFKAAGIRTSVFIEPDVAVIKLVPTIGADRIELYTEKYATNYESKEKTIQPFLDVAIIANDLGIGINAGHDLSLENLAFFSKTIPNLLEVSIGHALVADALYYGLEETIRRYKNEL